LTENNFVSFHRRGLAFDAGVFSQPLIGECPEGWILFRLGQTTEIAKSKACFDRSFHLLRSFARADLLGLSLAAVVNENPPCTVALLYFHAHLICCPQFPDEFIHDTPYVNPSHLVLLQPIIENRAPNQNLCTDPGGRQRITSSMDPLAERPLRHAGVSLQCFEVHPFGLGPFQIHFFSSSKNPIEYQRNGPG
jgi:hypothetical protein